MVFLFVSCAKRNSFFQQISFEKISAQITCSMETYVILLPTDAFLQAWHAVLQVLQLLFLLLFLAHVIEPPQCEMICVCVAHCAHCKHHSAVVFISADSAACGKKWVVSLSHCKVQFDHWTFANEKKSKLTLPQAVHGHPDSPNDCRSWSKTTGSQNSRNWRERQSNRQLNFSLKCWILDIENLIWNCKGRFSFHFPQISVPHRHILVSSNSHWAPSCPNQRQPVIKLHWQVSLHFWASVSIAFHPPQPLEACLQS